MLAKIIYRFISCLVVISISYQIEAQTITSTNATTIGGKEKDQGKCIAVDNSGNLIIAGNFSDTVDFDPGNGVAELIAQKSENIFITKYGPLGNFIWAKAIVGTGISYLHNIGTDQQGNIIFSGAYYGILDMDPSTNSLIFNSNGKRNYFITKLDKDGNLIWAKDFIKSDLSTSNSDFTTDRYGDIYFVSSFADSIDLDPGPNKYVLNGKPTNKAFICKLDMAGNFIWAKVLQGSGDINLYQIQIGSKGEYTIIGNFRGAADFDPDSSNTERLTVANPTTDGFVLRFDPMFQFVWVKQFESSQNIVPTSLSINKKGEVLLGGEFQGDLDADPNILKKYLLKGRGQVGFIVLLDSMGSFKWARNIESSFDEARITGVSLSEESIAYFIGNFQGITHLDTNASKLTSKGGIDIVLGVLDCINGKALYFDQIGGVGSEQVNDMHRDSSGTLYMSGWFYESTCLVPGKDSPTLASKGKSDMFYLKLKSTFKCSTSIASVYQNNPNSILSIYPNPNNGIFSLQFNSDKSIPEKIQIWNTEGKVIHEINDNTASIIQLDLSNELPGIYFGVVLDKTKDPTHFQIVVF